MTLIDDSNTHMGVHFSSKSNEWETPDDFFQYVDNLFDFTVDLAANKLNAKCEKFYSMENSAFDYEWTNDEVYWLNSPYGRSIKDWARKAYESYVTYQSTIVFLCPSRTDTLYFQKYLMQAPYIVFVKGRLKFINRTLPSYREDGNFKASSAPFPSALIIFQENLSEETLAKLGELGTVMETVNE